MRFHVLLEPADDPGVTAHRVEIPGAIWEGGTPEEALVTVQDAIRALLAVRLAEAQAKLKQPGHGAHLLETVDVHDLA